MTATVTFQGVSDDCIEIAGCSGADEFYVNSDGYGVFLLESPSEGGLYVRVAYEGRAGVWSVGVMPIEEGALIPEWPIRWANEERLNDYTACVAVDCPDDVSLCRRDEAIG